MQVARPFFDTGSVETALSKAKAAEAGAAGESSDAVLVEVEQEQQFERLVAGMRAGLRIADRMQHRVPFFKCFVGAELVDYLVRELHLDGRPAAVAAAQRWMDSGVFYHVTRTKLFTDSQVRDSVCVCVCERENVCVCARERVSVCVC
jgi:hypothetical protein